MEQLNKIRYQKSDVLDCLWIVIYVLVRFMVEKWFTNRKKKKQKQIVVKLLKSKQTIRS